MIIANSILTFVVAACTMSLLSPSIEVSGDAQAVDRWFRLQAMRIACVFALGVVALAALVLVNVEWA